MSDPLRTIEDYELRVPAENMSFQRPDLPVLVDEVEALLRAIDPTRGA